MGLILGLGLSLGQSLKGQSQTQYWLDGFLDFSRTDTGGANVSSTDGALKDNANFLQIG